MIEETLLRVLELHQQMEDEREKWEELERRLENERGK